MYPRLCIDITWIDLARAMGYCVWVGDPTPLPLSSVATKEAIVTLSVRSAFDLLLTALELPGGSEVLLGEVTVPHIERIVREHGLVPVSVPVDPGTLSVRAVEVEQRITPRSRVLVVAHLFGTRMPLELLGELCRERNIFLVEDCAQALTSGSPERDPNADASVYSFGPIKTATALGGGIALVKDEALRGRMTNIANSWSQQSTMGYAARVAKMAGLKLLSQPWLLTLLVRTIEALGGDADSFVGHSARGFADDHLLESLRHRPCPALQHLLARRLTHFDELRIAERTRRGQRLASSLPEGCHVAGCDNATHTYWVFPLVCEQSGRVVEALRRAGFDASQISGLTVVGDDTAEHWFHRTMFVPCGVQVPLRQLDRVAAIVRHGAAGRTSVAGYGSSNP